MQQPTHEVAPSRDATIRNAQERRPPEPTAPVPTAPNAPIPLEPSLPAWPSGVLLTADRKMSFHLPADLCVILSAQAFEQLFGYAYATLREISCLGVVRREGNAFIVERFHLVRQEGGIAYTEMDPAALGTLMEDLLAQGKAQEARSLKCWAHSHPGMGVFWSGTDDRTCRLLAGDYLVSLVVSNGYAIRCRIDATVPVPFVADDVPVLYEMNHGKERLEQYAREVAEKVRERSPCPAGASLFRDLGAGLGDEDLWSEYFRRQGELLDDETREPVPAPPEEIPFP